MKVKLIVPAWNGEIEEVVEEFEKINDCMGLSICILLLFLDYEIVLGFFLFDNVDDDFLEVAIESAYIDLTQLLFGLVNFFILDYILVD